MSVFTVPQPLGGISDQRAAEDQDPATSSDASNVVSVDPVSGRERIAQREGTDPYTPNPLGVQRVQHGTYVTYTQRQITYDTNDGVTEWEGTLPSKVACPAVAIDSQGATYWIDGKNGIQKRNADGAEVWQFTVPVKDELHVLRAICVDPLTDHLFVAVSEGGTQATSSLWCYAKDDEKHLVSFWSQPITLGAYIEEMVVHEGKLYTGQNFVLEQRSRVVVYGLIDTSIPEELWSKGDVPYPISGMRVNSKGEVVCIHAAVTTGRYYDARCPHETAIIDEPRWRPQDDPNFKKWHWATLMASEIPNQPGFRRIQDGDKVTQWRCSGPRGVVTMVPDPTTPTGGTYDAFLTPTYAKNSLGFKPAVRFRGNAYRLISAASAGNTAAINDILGTLLPGKGRGFIITMLVKVSEDTPTGGAAKLGRLWAQYNDSPGGLRALYVNRNAGGAAAANLVTTSMVRRTAAAGTTNPSTVAGQFNNDSGAAIITIASGNNTTALDRGCFRVNGVPLAYFDSTTFWTDPGKFSYLGCADDGTEGPVVDMLEIHVFQSADLGGGVQVLPDFPDYNVATSANTSDPTTSDTFVERLEGWIAFRNGISHVLDRGDQVGTTVVWDGSGGASAYGHPFSTHPSSPVSTYAPPNPNGRDGDANGGSWDNTLLKSNQLLTKWSAQRGNVRWANGSSTTGGVSSGLAIDNDDNIFTVGPVTNTTSGNPGAKSIRKFTDNGDTVSQAWTKEILGGGLAVGHTNPHARLVVDKFNNVWIPFHWTGADTQHSLIAYKTGGTLLLEADFGLVQSGNAVVLPPTYPDYTNNPRTITRPEFIYVATEGTDAIPTVHKMHILDVEQANTPPRLTRAVAVCGGSIVTFNSSSQSVPTGGSGALDSAALLVSSAWGQHKLWLTDGRRNLQFDPLTDTVSAWASSDDGSVPTKCKLLIAHQDRAVFARNEEDPQNWFMSWKGDFTKWDLFPSAGLVEGMAVAGNSGTVDGVKPAPDIITSLASLSREVMWIGCDSSIYAMIGDPTAGGYIDLVTEEMGMAFGYPYASDGQGAFYFVNNRCEVCVFNGRGITKISTKIDRRLRDIDLALNRFELQWDTEYQRLRMFVIPTQPTATPVQCWQWEKRFAAWWPVDFSQAVLQPTCSWIMDGDGAVDRAVLVGCQDGRVLKFNRSATTDNGYTIPADIVYGPYSSDAVQTRLKNIQATLASDQNGCRLELFASDVADERGEAKVAVDLTEGQNPRKFVGVRGAQVWLRLSNAAPGTRFAVESILAEMWPSGRKVVA